MDMALPEVGRLALLQRQLGKAEKTSQYWESRRTAKGEYTMDLAERTIDAESDAEGFRREIAFRMESMLAVQRRLSSKIEIIVHETTLEPE